MWLPCKVIPKEETKDKHFDLYINYDKNYEKILPQFAWADVNPNNIKDGKPYYFRLDSRFDNFLYLTKDDLAEAIYYSDEEIKNLALNHENVKRHTEGKEILLPLHFGNQVCSPPAFHPIRI